MEVDRIVVRRVIRFLWWHIAVPLWIHDPLKGVDRWDGYGFEYPDLNGLDPGKRYSMTFTITPQSDG